MVPVLSAVALILSLDMLWKWEQGIMLFYYSCPSFAVHVAHVTFNTTYHIFLCYNMILHCMAKSMWTPLT